MKQSPVRSPQGELCDKISLPAAILLSNDIHRGANMFLLPRNKVSVNDNTLHVQSGVTISTDGDFSEGETVFVIPASALSLTLVQPSLNQSTIQGMLHTNLFLIFYALMLLTTTMRLSHKTTLAVTSANNFKF